MIRTVSSGPVKAVNHFVLTMLGLGYSCLSFAEVQVNGTAAVDQRYFFQDANFASQDRANLSAYFEAEVYTDFNDGDDSILFKPYIRWDQNDDERTHGDIRELLWLHVGEDWELRTGISKVFWGQTESLHLVDIINQTDAIDSVDSEEKLGQPMVNLSLIRDWGTTHFYLLPYFRERTLASEQGRPRLLLPVENSDPLYESSDEQQHVDWAVRWQNTLGDWDVGISYFDGTSREPLWQVGFDSEANPQLLPFYVQIQQFGVDLLAVSGAWLFKFEGIKRKSNYEDFTAAVGGFEYTRVGVFDSIYDIGLLMEYQYDGRDNLIQAPGQNDVMLGTRIVFNDIDGTEILLGVVQDLDDSQSRSGFVEASSRINDNWKWNFDAWFFSGDEPMDPMYQYRRDDFAQLSLEYYF